MTHVAAPSRAHEEHGTAARLRLATRREHARAEAVVDLGLAASSLDGYAALLAAFAAGLAPLEASVAARVEAPDVPAGLRAGWSRSAALTADLEVLEHLGASPAPRVVVAPAGRLARAEAAGAWYVLEGSRLGGRVIARAVLAALPEAAPALRFLAGDDVASLVARWRSFGVWLDTCEPDQQAVVAGARLAFATLATALAEHAIAA